MTVAEALISLLFAPPPALVLIACYWRAIRLVNHRTPETCRRVARLMMRLIYCIAGAAIIWGVGAVLVLVAALTASDDIGEAALAGIGHGAVAVLLGCAILPLVRLRSAVQSAGGDDCFDTQVEVAAALKRVEIIFWVATVLFFLALATFSGFLIFGVLIFGLIPVLLWQRRRAREGQFLWLLALSVRSNHNLAQEVRDHADTWTGSYAVRLRQLAVYLKAGRPLGLALERVPGLLPRWVIASIKIGEETGTLSEVLNECATSQLNWMKERFRSGSVGSLLIYLACYPWVLITPITFMVYYIVPKMKAIFEGFGLELPSVTERFLQACDHFVNFGLPFMAPVSLVGVLLLLRFDHTGWRNVRFRLFRSLYPRYDAAPIMRHLARMIEKGKTIPDSLLAIANFYHRPTVGESIAQVYVATESGGDCWKALLQRGFLSRRDLALIEAAQRVNNLPWALREIADVREKRYVFRIDTLVQFFRPIPIIVIGLAVGWVCIAMFLPVIKIVSDQAIEKL